jgi:hypothetical protein
MSRVGVRRPCQALVERHRAELHHGDRHVVEPTGDRAGQLLADLAVVLGEHGQAEPVRPPQVRPGPRRVRDGHGHQRRVEAHRGEGAGREPDQLPVDLRRHRDHAARESCRTPHGAARDPGPGWCSGRSGSCSRSSGGQQSSDGRAGAGELAERAARRLGVSYHHRGGRRGRGGHEAARPAVANGTATLWCRGAGDPSIGRARPGSEARPRRTSRHPRGGGRRTG